MRHLISALSLVILFASFTVAPLAAHYEEEGCEPCACDIGMDQQAEDCADPFTITSTQRATMEAEIAQATSVVEIGSILTNYGFEFVRTVTLEEYQQELQSDQGHEYQEHTH